MAGTNITSGFWVSVLCSLLVDFGSDMTNVVEGAGAPLARLGARYRPRQAGGGRPRQARQVRPTMPAARPARQTEGHNTSDFQTAPPLHPSTFQCGADLNLSSRDFRPKTSEQASSGSKLGKTNGTSQFDHCVRAISIDHLKRNTSVLIQVHWNIQ